MNDNERRAGRGEPCSLEDEMEAALREADLALAEAEYLSKSQRDRTITLAFAMAPMWRRASTPTLPNLL